MRAEIQSMVDDIRQSLDLLSKHIDLDVSEKRLMELNARVEDPSLWNDSSEAQKVMQERAALDAQVSGYKVLSTSLDDNIELIEMAEMEQDQDMVDEAEASISEMHVKAAKLQLESLLSGEADSNNCFLEIHAGAGGTESCDWANILLRMYTRWSDSKGYKVEMLEESAGEEAGIKSTTLKISGHNAYGWLKTENGVHRLVRISPFDSQSRRHTSFSSVTVYPEVDDNIDIEIAESDLRIDTYRASGAGGQHVNTTDSAVRMTHIATGIVVQCQNDRSQHKNRATAMKMLQARLYERELQIREAEAQGEYLEKTDIGWGHQIRSYVLQPYQMVKDLRTGVEKSNSQGVLDGDLDAYLEAALALKLEGNSGEGIDDID